MFPFGTVYYIITSWCIGSDFRSNNFVVGLTNVHPLITTPTLWNYTLCGQYPGAVPAGATVSLYCQENLPPFRYVIVQFPITEHMNFCELEVIALSTSLSLFYPRVIVLVITIVPIWCLSFRVYNPKPRHLASYSFTIISERNRICEKNSDRFIFSCQKI